MKDKNGKHERIRKGEQMYDFYFLNYFAYYICKGKGEKKQARVWSIPVLISDNQDYQIPVHESDFYFSNYFAYYICKVKEREIKKTRKKFLFFKLFSILIV